MVCCPLTKASLCVPLPLFTSLTYHPLGISVHNWPLITWMLCRTIAKLMVWSFSTMATVVQLPSVALLVAQIFKETRDVDAPPMVDVVEVETPTFTLESFVDDICVPVAPVPTKDRLRVEVVRAVLGMVGLLRIWDTPLDEFQSEFDCFIGV